MNNRHKSRTLVVALSSVLVMLSLFQFSCARTQQGELSNELYTPPAWAPPYDDISAVPYYYFPDYGMYYDVAAREYWYPENGIWISSLTLPPRYRDLDLDHSYVVMLNKHASKPWLDHTYYSQNYPAHAHERYGEIVEQNHLITNVPPEHVVTPRAYNENNDRVTFVEHPRVPVPQPPAPRPVEPRRLVAQNPAVHEVPMRTISPAMPTESRRYNYGSGYHGR